MSDPNKYREKEGKSDTGWQEKPEGAVDEAGNRRRAAGVVEALSAEGAGEAGTGTGAPASEEK